MALTDLDDWMSENTGPDRIWYVKRLAANDTLASGAHQAGPYIPRSFLFDVFPSLNKPEQENPDVWFDLRVDSHPDRQKVRAVWYNNQFRGKTRNETRLTNFGGSNSALLDPESTGALAVFVFYRKNGNDATVCHVWVCRNGVEEDQIEDRIGPVDPGRWKIWSVDGTDQELLSVKEMPRTSCWLDPGEIPPTWLAQFPSCSDIIRRTIELRPDHGLNVDKRLLKRRECEYQIFRSVEEAVELPALKGGFNTIDEFVARAQTILQRRKSRSGRSLELHVKEILVEENFKEGQDFDYQPESDPKQRPDFLFPSETAYKNPDFPANNLRMLAAKTTCKDRWRQILNEAQRIDKKHLLTLQEGVSEAQFREMTDAKVQLVVPAALASKYPKSIQPHLQTFESFIGDIRLLCI